MKFLQVTLVLVLLGCRAFAQDTTLFKQQAGRFADATFKNNQETVIELTYPSLIELSGGSLMMQKLMTDKVEALKKRGVIYIAGEVGSPGKFYRSAGQVYCLIPESVKLQLLKGYYLAVSYLLGISDNNGHDWKFLDVGGMSADTIKKLLPSFNNAILIPSSGKMQYFE